MRVGQEVKSKTETSEVMKLRAKKDVDNALRSSLIDADSGLLRPGQLPKVDAISSSAAKTLVQAFGQAKCCEET